MIKQLSQEIKHIELSQLPLSPYGIKSLQRTVDAIDYYLEIYRNALEKALEQCQLSPNEMTIVDYGGGHGLLSIFAKRAGFRTVVYIDHNDEALSTAQCMAERLGAHPDAMLLGDTDVLEKWCITNGIKPNALVAIDVIEHIYVLDDFFSSLHSISPEMTMVFTTASNPHNRRVVRRLQEAMVRDEKNFIALRRKHILSMNPDMPNRQLDYWAKNTRGLIYSDIDKAIEAQSPNLLLDSYNTCDPATGSWTERILPIDDYRQILKPYALFLTVTAGHYNVHRSGVKKWVSSYLNRSIIKAPQHQPNNAKERRQLKKALKKAPFIYLLVTNASK